MRRQVVCHATEYQFMKLSLGPIQTYWPRDQVLAFYQAVAESPVDIVYLGEAVCSRRHEMRLKDWLDIAANLRDAGKDAILSTQVLIESGADVTVLHKIAENREFGVEANDMGAVRCLEGKVPFVGGPHLNLYNLPTLELMAGLGMQRWVMPLEMTRTDLAVIQEARPAGLQTEVFVYGRMPLAFSARCFTARYRNLPKDDCQFSCIDYPDGLLMRTREDQEFLVLNGIQTQSAHVYNLLSELPDLAELGVDVVRVSPQSLHTPRVLALFAAAMRAGVSPSAAHAELLALMPDKPCNGYWYGRPGLNYHVPVAELAHA
jgi:collagenase-like PrtC family protease